jgi:hypothetical protein
VSATGRVRLPSRGTLSRGTLAAALTAALAVGVLAGSSPSLFYRPLFAALVFANLALAVVFAPRAAVVATFAFLPAMALVRRLLIDDAGWTSRDPLLLVGPCVALLLLCRLFIVERRPLPSDLVSRLAMALLALAFLGALNPSGGGLRAGLAGLLFLGVPLVWYLVGRELAERPLVATVMKVAIFVAVANAAYGIVQSEIALPSWDARWVDVNGYYALLVGGAVRPFGTFSSATEYLMYLSAGVVFCVAMWRAQRARRWLLPVPLLVAALFIGSGRAALGLCALALIVMAGLGSGRPRRAAAVVLAGLALVVFGAIVVAPRVADSGNPLIRHQAAGLARPFDSRDSTLGIHWDLFRGGVEEGLRHPVGLGTGVTNLASGLGDSERTRREVKAGVFQGRANLETDIDVSNVFLSLGVVGGVLYLALIAAVLWRTASLYVRSRDPFALGVVGLLVATLGQWLAGGHYALSPLTWLLAGWAMHGTRASRGPTARPAP